MRMREVLTLMKVKGDPKGKSGEGVKGWCGGGDSLRMIKHYKLLTSALENGGERHKSVAEFNSSQKVWPNLVQQTEANGN